jgi:dipeptidyl aminopeptidase/acylaminoacyl peptidase
VLRRGTGRTLRDLSHRRAISMPIRTWQFVLSAALRALSFQALALLIIAGSAIAQERRPLTWEDMMHFRAIEETQIAHDGSVVVLSAVPDRGDSEVLATTIDGRTTHTIARGRAPQVSPDGRFVVARLEPPFAETARNSDRRNGPRPGLAILDMRTGAIDSVAQVKRFALSADGRFVAFTLHASADTSRADSAAAANKKWQADSLIVRNIENGARYGFAHVTAFEWSEKRPALAMAVAGDSLSTALRVLDLLSASPAPITIHSAPGQMYDQITWNGRHASTERLAFVAGEKSDERNQPGTVGLWDGSNLRELAITSLLPEGWITPVDGSIAFSRDGNRLFAGARRATVADTTARDTTASGLFNVDEILRDRTVDVWHVDDTRIHTQQRQVWSGEQRATSPVIFHIDQDRIVVPVELDRGFGSPPDNPRAMLATDPTPYFPYMTFEGFFSDVYVVDLSTGEESLVVERLSGSAQLSPDGRHVVYFQDENWHVFDVDSRSTRNLTASLDVSFAREDHDLPSERPGYGVGGWVADGSVFVNDRYDVWQIALDGSSAARITSGRADERVFRVVDTDPEREWFAAGDETLLRSYNDRLKNFGFYRARAGRSGAERLVEEDARFDFVAKARDADRHLYTRQTYTQFPDLLVGGPDFRSPRRLTDVNPQVSDFRWGTSELIEWRNTDGVPVRGVVIKPDNFDSSRRYPVVVYYYESFSQRLHEFNRPQINHRPVFPFYAGQDYVVFLPDVVFEVGRPGYSAVKSLVPGVQRLIDLGIADPDRIGLHGHSWSGYMTAFVVTMTDIFRTAIAGAPVSNMTSAYTGIRWGSGLARLFQYETGQSRLGVSMWENRQPYIDNSPVFFADRINTPLLIIHGDDDGAVPWYQSIELYLAMRRLGKEAVFLQYRGEDHHPAAYPNKLDWALKMNEWFDHYLKDEPVSWIEEGVPYAGE